MIVRPIKTRRVEPGLISLTELLDEAVEGMSEGSILVITSKVVSICEGRVASRDAADKDELIRQESTYYLPSETSKYGHRFTITNDTLIPGAGIDESNGGGDFILWPEDSQRSANEVRLYLVERFGLHEVGVLITDSTCSALRLGTTGIALAHCGFSALNDYVGKPDLFGRPFAVSQSSITGGLAAGAVVAMGEGAEQTPLALISDVSFVQFQQRDPSEEELSNMHIPLKDDLFAPFLENAPWLHGDKASGGGRDEGTADARP